MMDILPNTVIHDLTAQSGHPVQILVLLGCASCFAGKPGHVIGDVPVQRRADLRSASASLNP
jgi:hypothetical protein